jgi:hypothetical protein
MVETIEDRRAQETVRLLVLAVGGSALAEVLGVTPSAITLWSSGQALSTQSRRQIDQVAYRLSLRETLITAHLDERLAKIRRQDVSLVTETVTGDAFQRGPAADGARQFLRVVSSAETARLLARAYLAAEMVVDGDVLVFARQDVTHFCYLNSAAVRPGFRSRAHEPWPTLRPLIKTRGRGL